MWKIKRHQELRKVLNAKKEEVQKLAVVEEEAGEYTGKIIQHNKQSYILINKLGVGAYATVWMCYNVTKKDLYAIKIFKPKEKNGAVKEIAIYEKFNKMNIRYTVKMHDSFEKDEKMYVVIDLMAGSMYDLIKKGCIDDSSVVTKDSKLKITTPRSNKLEPENKTPEFTFKKGFSLDLVIRTLHNILEALVDLHNNKIIHGDVKPDNILLFGRSKMHDELLKKLINKTAVKKISDCIKETCKTFVLTNKNDDEDESEYSSEYPSSEYSKSSLSKKAKSDMSLPPDMIILSDESDDKSDNDINVEGYLEEGSGSHSGKSERKIVDYLKLPKIYTLEPSIKLSDMGSCVDVNASKKPIAVQTKYYKSPELILGLEYDTSCDIWALGCSAYELLTGKILFNPDEYIIDKKRCLLHLIYAALGKIPNEMADRSPYRQIFFTDGYTLKANSAYDDELYQENVWIEILRNVKGDPVLKHLLLNLMLDMLKIDPKIRITAQNALDHPLFKLYFNKKN